jgi:L-lysine cyclodeaminase
MSTLLIGQADLRTVLDRVGRDELMRRVMDRIADGMRAVEAGTGALSPLRDGFERPDPVPGVLEWMPHRVAGDSITIKTVAYSPANPQVAGLPTILGTLNRFDDRTGRLLAVADGVLVTAIRTGATSAVASRALARPGSTAVGLIGCGAQAVTQLHALSLVFDVRTVLVADADPAHAASFARRVAFLGLDVRPTTAARVLAEADVLTTATSIGVGDGPVVPDGPHRPHLHVNAIGSDLIGKTELPQALLRRAVVVPDHPEQALREGECQQLRAADLGPQLSRVCADPSAVPDAADRLTVFDSTGFALLDHLALDVVIEAAAEVGAGRHVSVEHHPVDALDPYSPHRSRTAVPVAASAA